MCKYYQPFITSYTAISLFKFAPFPSIKDDAIPKVHLIRTNTELIQNPMKDRAIHF